MMEQTQENNAVVPGQGVLPGLLDVMRIESAVLKKPAQEEFCWEFVTNGGDRGRAFQVAIDPSCDRLQAQKNAHLLLKKEEISRRVMEISSIIQRKYEQKVISYRMKGMTLDRNELLNEDGKCLKTLKEMTEEQRQIVDLEVRWVDGALRTIPVVASKEKSAEALQKMFGLNKDSLAVTGPGGASLPAPVIGVVTNFDEFRELAKGKVNPSA